MTERAEVQGWEVNVVVNGETILTIGHNHLSGIESIENYADVVRNCARHLDAFIGLEQSSQAFLLEDPFAPENLCDCVGPNEAEPQPCHCGKKRAAGEAPRSDEGGKE